MKEVLLAKEEGLRIALSILSGDKAAKEFGSAALKDTQLILKNILETMKVEKEMAGKSPVKPNKEILPSMLGNDTKWKKMTILKMEEDNEQ